ncbi:MAG: outer membrane protein assembly factor BamE [Gemmatimonadaceae bacterium]
MTVLCIASLSTAAAAQAATIDPGMTREQVVAKLGQPLSSRSYDGHTYLLYKNGCEKKCGMNDLVMLDSGKVVDAVFRSSARHYSGKSSSPVAIPADVAKHGGATAPLKVIPTPPKKPS